MFSLEAFCSPTIKEYGSVSLNIPDKALASGSLQISDNLYSSYVNLEKDHHADIFTAFKEVVSLSSTNQYLVYGKEWLKEERPFAWEVVPYYETSNIVSRIWQQFLVLFRITFGGMTVTEVEGKNLFEKYHQLLNDSDPIAQKVNRVAIKNDAFCDSKVVEKQLVFEGQLVNILYNYAPIGLGGERLHFLIVPKRHVEDFVDLTEDEYLETSELAKSLLKYISETRPDAQSAHMFYKAGIDAGQTQSHCHMHIIFEMNAIQGLIGRVTVLKNILLGASPMKVDQLRDKVFALKSELRL